MEDRNEWATPQWLFDYFDAQYGFTLDPCATPDNAKCERYFTKKENGLIRSWGEGWAFVNPPYGKGLLGPWVEKVFTEATLFCGSLMLLPSRTEQKWFHWCLREANEIIFIEGRVNYVPPLGVKPSTNRENSIVVVVKPFVKPKSLAISSVNVRELKKGAAGNPRKLIV